MNIEIYPLHPHFNIQPADTKRGWMDLTRDKFAYRCLPLTIANQAGWTLHCEEGFNVEWNGGPEIEDMRVALTTTATSHFGHGILTFHIQALFRTPPGVYLWVRGPVNAPKDSINALEGIVETDWAPNSFTMNWQFTRPGIVSFVAGEAFCHIVPVQKEFLETVQPTIRKLTDCTFLDEYRHWAEERDVFNEKLKTRSAPGAWQKDYYRRANTRLHLKPIKES